MKKKLIYLVFSIVSSSVLFTACGDDANFEEDKTSKEEIPNNKGDEAVVKNDTVEIKATWNEDHPRYEITVTTQETISQAYVEEVYTDHLDNNSTTRIIELKPSKPDSKTYISDEAHYESNGSDIFEATAYFKCESGKVIHNKVIIKHPAVWETIVKRDNISSHLYENTLYIFMQGKIEVYSCDTGKKIKTYNWIDNNWESETTCFENNFMYAATKGEPGFIEIYRLDLNTGDLDHLASLETDINRMWVENSNIYYCDLHTQLRKVDLENNHASTIYLDGGFNFLSIDNGYVYGRSPYQLSRYKSEDPNTLELLTSPKAEYWQFSYIVNNQMYYMSKRKLYRIAISELEQGRNQKAEDLDCPFENKFEYGNSLQVYCNDTYIYVRIKSAGKLLIKRRLVNPKK